MWCVLRGVCGMCVGGSGCMSVAHSQNVPFTVLAKCMVCVCDVRMWYVMGLCGVCGVCGMCVGLGV